MNNEVTSWHKVRARGFLQCNVVGEVFETERQGRGVWLRDWKGDNGKRPENYSQDTRGNTGWEGHVYFIEGEPLVTTDKETTHKSPQ
jgi:hypothetical protein